ncbi:hypothetical protein BJ546DRAFT_379787 [Cryomyces antarcticus]|uniref:UPF0390 protein n=1 Tax=Cryomyces minteri TaxID=331657 RepID=A0A4U0XNX6_9PEZI|nr:UPF0390 protein [Cryomyces minteri]
MAQGAVKKSKANAPKKPTASGPKRGARVIKPKKAVLVKQNQIKKKHSAGLSAMTEKALAERAGHLEMLRGGKKDGKKEDKAAGGKGNKSGK